jgi:HAD superfamily hydrolase (TIGR01490 family)
LSDAPSRAPGRQGPRSGPRRRPLPAQIPSGDRLAYPPGEGPSLTLFDLDDTLLPLDSDHAWGEFMIRIGWVDAVAFKRRNDEFYAQYKLGALDIHAYIEFATQPLRARGAEAAQRAHAQFMHEVITPNLRPAALELVRSHQARGDTLVLVTATNDFVTAPIARALGIDALIAVRLERGAGGTITGRIEGTPSYREGKVQRVQQWLGERDSTWQSFDRISVYSDSVNDLALLERASDPVATNPTPALEAIATERGWRILKLFE